MLLQHMKYQLDFNLTWRGAAAEHNMPTHTWNVYLCDPMDLLPGIGIALVAHFLHTL